MTFALAAWGVWIAHPVHGQTPRHLQRLTTTTVHSLGNDPLPRANGTSVPRLDLYGNEVENAVGDYRQDRQGDTYERHSPQTAITRLPPAGT
jgi:hypothetical protein